MRYSTSGSSSLRNAQPLKIRDLCVAHNGTITNAEQISNMVGGCSFSPQNTTDTLIATKRLVTHLKENNDMVKAMSILKNEMAGSYCFTFLTDDNYNICSKGPQRF